MTQTLAVIFTPEAAEQLAALYRYIADAASPTVAAHYTDAVVTFCENLHVFPLRGTPRDDIRPGLRTTYYHKRTVIAYTVEGNMVFVIGVFHGGQDYETNL